MALRRRGSVLLEITDEDILDKMTDDELQDWYQAGRSRYQVGKEARRRWEKKAVAAAPAEEAPKKAMKTGRPRSVRACADIWALHLCMKKKAASAEEASQSHKKAIQKGMEKAAAPAEEAHKKAMQKGMKKKAVSTEKAHWKSLKKRMKCAIMRRPPGEPPPEKPRQKGTVKNHIIKAKKANWRNLLRCDVAPRHVARRAVPHTHPKKAIKKAMRAKRYEYLKAIWPVSFGAAKWH